MYAEILLDQKVGKDKDTLTYKIPQNLAERLELGSIVEIPLRNRKTRGIVAQFHEHEPAYQTKEILDIASKAPHLKPWQVKLLFWISDYYFCPPFKVLKLFFPANITKKKKLHEWTPYEKENPFEGKKLKLTTDQEKAVKSILETDRQTVLLHGVTGSGKTEIYRRITENTLKQGKQILILVPEITLTPQTFQSFQQEFGENIAILHSQLTGKQKENYWYRIFHGETGIIIGSRSALFAPFRNLGAVIIDEEHEPSYKQDQAPRYHARDVALQIGKLLKIKVILGSATPSIETYLQARQKRYELVELKERIQRDEPVALPDVTVVDLREEIKKQNYSIFSETLARKINDKLENNVQSILFLNRRGAASAVLCRECGHIEKCGQCDVALTYHKQMGEKLVCHHCGNFKKVPATCPDCRSAFIRYIGLGTQKIEEKVRQDYPAARVLRADRDTVRHHDSFKRIYEDFKNHRADILIGTQMIGKGLHLPQVNLVGVVLADLSLTIPDFRSAERTFQILTQVAGRSGRNGSKGEVVIQTYLPHHYAVRAAAAHDYTGFFEEELKIRKAFNYPPFSRIIKTTIVDKNPEKAHQKAKEIFDILNGENNAPELQNVPSKISLYPAFIHKLQNKYRWIILATGQEPSLLLKRTGEKHPDHLEDPAVRIDVDPLSSS
jgi:primosomal protein N' (replication factor Y)